MTAKQGDPQFQAELLGYHLGLSDPKEQRDVESAFNTPEDLRAARGAVQRVLAPLEMDPTPDTPAHLADRVMARIDRLGRTIPFPRQAALKSGDDAPRGGPVFSARDLVGLAAAILIFVGIFVPGYRAARTASQRQICANNLRGIGTGMDSYSLQFGGQLPFAGLAQPSRPQYSLAGADHGDAYRNSQNTFLLVKNRLVHPQLFVCRERPGAAAMSAQQIAGRSDFPDPRNNSYASQILPRPLRRDAFEPDMPIAADANPVIDEWQGNLDGFSAPDNSINHGEAGQNVLRNDMSVRWYRTPRAGIENDDIYRLIGVMQYTGREAPSLRSDAFLVP
jgi:hypothetical protein